MSKYAFYDKNAVQPTPVIGWLDTEFADYPDLPPEDALIPVTEQEWLLHLDYNLPPWYVLSGQLIPKPEQSFAEIADNFAKEKASTILYADQLHSNAIQSLTGNPTQVEKDTWSMKLATAKSVLNKTDISIEGATFMTALGLNTTTDQTKWADSVMVRATEYAKLVGVFDTLRSTARMSLSKATDKKTLDSLFLAVKDKIDSVVAAL